MYVVTFLGGALSVLFTVSDGTLFVSIVPPDSYVDGQSLIYGSRAFSFMGGPSVGRPAGRGADRAVRGRRGRAVLPRLGAAAGRDQAGRAALVRRRSDGVTAGLRFIARSPLIRASLTGVAVINFFNMMFSALFMLYAVRAAARAPGGARRRHRGGRGRRDDRLADRQAARGPARHRAGLRGRVLRLHRFRWRWCRWPPACTASRCC